jgi:hypothetical protein
MRITEIASSKLSFNTTKGSNTIGVEMNVDGQYAGTFQYDADNGRSLVELDPTFQSKGLGKILILKGIYTDIMSVLDYVEDESRTQAFDNAMDSLADSGYIVNDDEYWYVTGEGEQYLKQVSL